MADPSLPRCIPKNSAIGAPAPSSLDEFREHVTEFYQNNRREFPWREHITPYRIVVSEIMLQQTAVDRVKKKFESFLEIFPDFITLAGGGLSDVMRAWQGLGYNKRALSLQKLAQIVVENHSGILPDDESTLRALPGIGHATAGAIVAFAFNKPSFFIETNIRRVFIHHFFPNEENVTDRRILELVKAGLDRENPRDWYYALMDYGTFLAKNSVNPNRKSAHYAKQSRFRGSDRQIRGEVIRSMLGKNGVSVGDLAHLTGCSLDRLILILESLIKDGLIARCGQVYRIA